MAPHVVVAGEDDELARLGPRSQELRRPLELGRLAREREVAGDEQAVRPLVFQGPQDLPQDLRGVAVTITCCEAVAGVSSADGDVEVADVSEADDAGTSFRFEVNGW